MTADRPVSPFWTFSLRFYRDAAVAEACLVLQDEAGVDVNLLLFLIWQATERRALSAGEIADLDARVRPWRDVAVLPLRAVRRALKEPPQIVPTNAAQALRSAVKAVELQSEQLQQEAMFALAQAAPPGREAASAEAAVRVSLAAYQEISPGRFPAPALATLIAAAIRT